MLTSSTEDLLHELMWFLFKQNCLNCLHLFHLYVRLQLLFRPHMWTTNYEMVEKML